MTPRMRTETSGFLTSLSNSHSSADLLPVSGLLNQEMISELSVQHAYIAGGDWQRTTRAPVALAGAVFTLDSARNKYRISKIYEGQNEEQTLHLSAVPPDASPLWVSREHAWFIVEPCRLLAFVWDGCSRTFAFWLDKSCHHRILVHRAGCCIA